MADVLSQTEVDALLNAVDEGALEDIEEKTTIADEDISIYDFKRPERVSKDQIRALETLHEIFARNLNATLSAYMRTIVEVKLSSVEQLTYSEFIMSIPNPTCFNVLSCKPLKGEIVLELNPSIVFPIIDKLLGGNLPDAAPPDRPLTDIEMRLIDKIITLILSNLRDTWYNIIEIDFQVQETESNPQLMQIVPPTEVVVLICFEIRMGEYSGMMNLCIPFTVIEPVMSKFTTQNWFGYSQKERDEHTVEKLNEGLKKAPLKVVVTIASTKITLREFARLKVGSIILTDKQIKEPLLMRIDNFPKFKGVAGIFRNKKAFKITGRASLQDDD